MTEGIDLDLVGDPVCTNKSFGTGFGSPRGQDPAISRAFLAHQKAATFKTRNDLVHRLGCHEEPARQLCRGNPIPRVNDAEYSVLDAGQPELAQFLLESAADGLIGLVQKVHRAGAQILAPFGFLTLP